jgi:hypothetical protein
MQETWAVDDKHVTDVIRVRMAEFRDNLRDTCLGRTDDSWAVAVYGRLG